MSLEKSSRDFELPAGFRWAAASAEIKKKDRLDVGIAVVDSQCTAAGVFTKNLFAAAPVTFSRELLQNGNIRGVVVNSGCANAATGKTGNQNARIMSESAAKAVQTAESRFLVCSTGTIGVQLPMDRITAGIEVAAGKAAATRQAFMDFATSILTTDTCDKISARSFTCNGHTGRVIACAKGAGMIAPDMATLLAFVFTDVAATNETLQKCFEAAVSKSLNCITIDGDTSTNDTALILASGASGLEITQENSQLFTENLTAVMQSLAKQLARDGEGATKLVEITVTEAPDFETARRIGLSIGNSNLVKTAIYGRDANWGRIACAAGYAGCPFDPEKVSIKLGDLLLFESGTPLPLDEEAALIVLSREYVPITVSLGLGSQQAVVWTCDLTEKYIEINGSYRT